MANIIRIKHAYSSFVIFIRLKMAFLTVKTLHNPVLSFFLLYNRRKRQKVIKTSLERRIPLVFYSYVKDTQYCYWNMMWLVWLLVMVDPIKSRSSIYCSFVFLERAIQAGGQVRTRQDAYCIGRTENLTTSSRKHIKFWTVR